MMNTQCFCVVFKYGAPFEYPVLLLEEEVVRERTLFFSFEKTWCYSCSRASLARCLKHTGTQCPRELNGTVSG